MNKYLEKIAKKEEGHDWRPGLISGAASIPLDMGIGYAAGGLSKKFFKGRGYPALVGALGGATSFAEADYIQRRAEEMRKNASVGKHNEKPDSAFKRKELSIGRKIEKEHTGDYQTAENIAKDHLSEIPDYYTRLKKMEKSAKLKRALHKLKEEVQESSEHAVHHVEPREKKHKRKGDD